MNLRAMTGGMKTTPITAMESLQGIPSFKDRRGAKVLIQDQKFKKTPAYHMKEHYREKPISRLKRTSFMQNKTSF